MSYLINGVMIIILLISLAVWSFVGLIFWIPLLLRATTVFSAVIIHSAITKQDPHTMRHGLESAASFYFNGFRNIIITLFDDTTSSTEPFRIRISVVLLEILWATVTWLIIILFFFQPSSIDQTVFTEAIKNIH